MYVYVCVWQIYILLLSSKDRMSIVLCSASNRSYIVHFHFEQGQNENKESKSRRKKAIVTSKEKGVVALMMMKKQKKIESSNICVLLTLLFGVQCSVFAVQLFTLIPKSSSVVRIELRQIFIQTVQRAHLLFSIHILFHFIRIASLAVTLITFSLLFWINKKKHLLLVERKTKWAHAAKLERKKGIVFCLYRYYRYIADCWMIMLKRASN